MRIAILELYCGKSGKSGYYNSQEIGLAKAYAGMGHNVFVVLPNSKIKQSEIIPLTESITIVYMPAKVIGVHSFYRLSCLKKWKIDLVHIDADNQIYAVHVMKFCLKNQIRFYNYVGTISSDSDKCIKKFLSGIMSRTNIKMYSKTDTFVKTERVQQLLLQRGVKNTIVEPVGLDFDFIPIIAEDKEQIRERLHLPKQKKLLLFVGRLEEYKKPMDAVLLLNEMNNEYVLIMIGNGTQKKQILQKTYQLGVQNRIIFIDKILNSEIHQYYKAADCLINFNEKEIFGMSILEAIYQGCPVVARHAPGPDTIVQQGITGFLCDTLGEMKTRIMNMNITMPENIKTLMKENFSWNNTAKSILAQLNIDMEK